LSLPARKPLNWDRVVVEKRSYRSYVFAGQLLGSATINHPEPAYAAPCKRGTAKNDIHRGTEVVADGEILRHRLYSDLMSRC
jgi:hypothetical protein